MRLAPPISALPNGDSGSQRKDIWIGQRFLMNEFGHYTVTGDCGTERIMIEIDPLALADQGVSPERSLGNMRATIQAAARRKWEAGEASPVFYTHSGRLKHHAIALTTEDL